MSGYAELGCLTNFSFLRGASHAHELVSTAKRLGLSGLGIADINTLAGVVRAHSAAREAGLRLIVGARVHTVEGHDILVYPRDRAAYGRLSQLLSNGKLVAEKGDCHIALCDLLEAREDQIFIVMPPEVPGTTFADALRHIGEIHPDGTWLAAQRLYRGDDRTRLSRLAEMAGDAGVPLIAVGDAWYHAPERRPLQDTMTCIREHCTLDTAGLKLAANAERHLKSPHEMRRLFRGFEAAVARTEEVFAKVDFSLDALRYEYPDEPVPPDKTPQQHLTDLAWAGAARRYGATVPPQVARQIEKELDLIGELDYARYFLTVNDIVAWARDQDILCQGRGSAANSAVCFCLGITSVDPDQTSLLFERFISRERREPPDIDVDFEHERREEVIQYVYRRYGRARAALTATVISYRPRSAIREVCKALGLADDIASALAGTVWGSWGKDIVTGQIREAGLDPGNPMIRLAVKLARELVGFPRHLSQHVGGFVLTRGPLTETVPIGNAAMEARTFIEWDKDDIEALGLMKVDVLALGMLTCIRKAFDLLRAHKSLDFDLATVPADDPATYDMLCNADSLGVFQVESRAQMNMLPRLRPRAFYDLVIEVAIVRPGPIQGDMVHPYLRRRQGKEKVSFPRPSPEHGPPDELERILGRTLGVPLFQEQAMQIAIDAAKFTPDEANGLRRAMATFRKVGTIPQYEEKMVDGMVRRGYEPGFAARCFQQIKGFGEYGFPESHAASFALLVYVSSWLKCHHPDVFCAALLNAQPMGFYAPAQIVRDAREHGVEVLPVDVNLSDWDNTLEPASTGEGLAVRLGFRQVDGMAEAEAEAMMAARGAGYPDIAAIRRRAGVTRRTIELIANADGFGSMGLDRRQALWAVRAETSGSRLPLFAAADIAEQGEEPNIDLPGMPLSEQVIQDYQTTRLSLKAHPMSFLRESYANQRILTTAQACDLPNGARVSTAGMVLVRQKPGSASGVVFITLEDETGIANLVVWPKLVEKFRAVVMGARLLQVEGRVQSADNVVHVVAHRLIDRTSDLSVLSEHIDSDPLEKALANADEVKRPVENRRTPVSRRPSWRHPRDVRVLPPSRDFH